MKKYLTKRNIIGAIIVCVVCTIIILSLTACGGTKREHRNPTLSDPNGTILTEHILYEDIEVEDWDSNVTYWEDVQIQEIQFTNDNNELLAQAKKIGCYIHGYSYGDHGEETELWASPEYWEEVQFNGGRIVLIELYDNSDFPDGVISVGR